MLKALPNILSLLRLILIIPVLTLFQTGHRFLALVVFVIAMLLDVLDGYLARKFHAQTKLGLFLDPLADKLVIFITFLVFFLNGEAPVWGFLIFARDIGVIIELFVLIGKYGAKIGEHLRPSVILGKIVTLFQVISLLLVFIKIPSELILIFFVLTGGLSVFAGIQYVIRALSSSGTVASINP